MTHKVLVFSHACLRRVNRLVFEELNKNSDFEINIVAPSAFEVEGEIQEPDPVSDGDIPVVFKKLKKSNPRVYQFENTIELLNQFKPDVVYLDNDPVSMQALLIGKWANRNSKKLICLSCENLSFDLSASLTRLGWRGIVTSLFKNVVAIRTKKLVSHVFTINNEGTEIFKSLGYKSVSRCVLGFDGNIFFPNEEKRQEVREKLDFKSDEIIIAYVGRMVREKGIHLLIRSLREVQGNWKLMLDKFSSVRTPYQDKILNLIESNKLQERVVYFEASHSEIPNYMNAADVIVLPSVSTKTWVEQYGRVMPEALACGKLVIASNTGALPMLVGEHGILVEENNEAALTSTFNDIILNPEKIKSVSVHASKYAHQQLSIQTQCEQIGEVITNFKYENL